MTTITRPGPTNLQNEPGYELDLLWDQMADVVEATEIVANAALPATQIAAGGLISDASAKATPIDTDVVALSDSEAAGVLKKLHWSLVKSELSIYKQQVFMPDNIGWDYGLYPIIPSITKIDGRRRRGSAGITPEALFDLFSTARTAPVTTYYVSAATGSDSNNGLTVGSKVRSINKAVLLGNATGSAYLVYIDAGLYYRSLNFCSTTSTQVLQDAAFIAVGGTVVCSSCDQFTAPSLDGTYTNCYAIAMTGVEKVVDLLQRSANGSYQQMVNVATAALCNVRPGSWASVSGTIYVNRSDGLAVTNTNTRTLRTSCSLLIRANISAYLGSLDGESGWAFEGGDSIGAVRVSVTTPTPNAHKALVLKNVAFAHAGGIVSTGGRCIEVDSFPGIVALYECSATKSRTDLFNAKNGNGAVPPPVLLTVNCVGVDTGEYNGTSCNAWTLHDDVVGMDIAGYYEGGAGGTIHNIVTSRAALVGTYVGLDRGDKVHGGSIEPTAIRAANTATIDCYAVSVWQPVSGMAYHADDTSVIRLFGDCTWPARYAGDVTVVVP